MSEFYTAQDLETAAALRYSPVPGEFDALDDETKARVRDATSRILAVVAPAIAARALREFADNHVGVQTPARMAEDLHERADEIANGRI